MLMRMELLHFGAVSDYLYWLPLLDFVLIPTGTLLHEEKVVAHVQVQILKGFILVSIQNRVDEGLLVIPQVFLHHISDASTGACLQDFQHLFVFVLWMFQEIMIQVTITQDELFRIIALFQWIYVEIPTNYHYVVGIVYYRFGFVFYKVSQLRQLVLPALDGLHEDWVIFIVSAGLEVVIEQVQILTIVSQFNLRVQHA